MVTEVSGVAGLQAGQKAWRVDDGSLVVTEILRLPDDQAKPELFFRVRAWAAEANGSPRLDLEGLPIAIPEKRHSVVKCSLAHGKVALPQLLAQMEDAAIARVRTWLATQDVLQSLPKV